VQKITANIRLETPEDIEAVFRMTPYYFHTSEADKQKLLAYQQLDTPIEFVIGCYTK
jgi:23S rRNA (guanine745-N1)-methyltransferase